MDFIALRGTPNEIDPLKTAFLSFWLSCVERDANHSCKSFQIT